MGAMIPAAEAAIQQVAAALRSAYADQLGPGPVR
jgi:hypothetical protein